jgi:hypothetical protein
MLGLWLPWTYALTRPDATLSDQTGDSAHFSARVSLRRLRGVGARLRTLGVALDVARLAARVMRGNLPPPRSWSVGPRHRPRHMAPLGVVLYAALLATNAAACAGAGSPGFWSFLRPSSSAPPGGPTSDETSWRVSAVRVDAGPLDRPAPDVHSVNTTGFLTASSSRFMLGCREFLPVGAPGGASLCGCHLGFTV